MAKLSARGCHKLAQGTKHTVAVSGSRITVRLALRSDGKVLRAIDVHHDTYGGGTSRGGYSIIGSLSDSDRGSMVERFERYCVQRGFDFKAT